MTLRPGPNHRCGFLEAKGAADRHHQRRRQPANPVNRYMFLPPRQLAYDETEAIVNHLVGLGINQIAVFYQNGSYGE